MSKLRSLIAAAAFLGVFLLPAAWAQTRVGGFHREFTVSGAVMLNASTGAGSIQVTGEPNATSVAVEAVIHQQRSWLGSTPDATQTGKLVEEISAHPPLRQAGNIITIEPLGPEFSHSGLSISYVIATPLKTQLRVRSGSGAIAATNLSLEADLGTGSGSIHAGQLRAGLRAQTGSGSIAMDDVAGDVTVQTGSGSVSGSGVSGWLNARTGSGSIRLDGLRRGGDIRTGSGSIRLDQLQGDLAARAGSGSIHVGGILAAEHRWRLSTGSGSVHLRLPGDTQAQFNLRSGSGGISVDLPVKSGTHARHARSGFLGAAAAPSAQLQINTGSGSIGVRRQ